MYSCPIHARKTQRECRGVVPLIRDGGARQRWTAMSTLIVSYFWQCNIKSIKPICSLWAKFHRRLNSLTPVFLQCAGLYIYIHTQTVLSNDQFLNLPPILTRIEHPSNSYKPDTIFKFLSIVTSSLYFSVICRYLYFLCYLVLCCTNSRNKIL